MHADEPVRCVPSSAANGGSVTPVATRTPACASPASTRSRYGVAPAPQSSSRTTTTSRGDRAARTGAAPAEKHAVDGSVRMRRTFVPVGRPGPTWPRTSMRTLAKPAGAAAVAASRDWSMVAVPPAAAVKSLLPT